MTKIVNINNSFESYQQLISFYEENKDKLFSDIHIELIQWFSANMSAALGALLDLLAKDFNDITFNIPDKKIERILSKNDFLTFYGRIREVWAIIDTHSTKEVTGGIGLALLREFIEKNNGKMQIISDSGFYQFGKNGEFSKEFQGRFPGTIVNLQFNTNDTCNYCLSSEIDINKIF